MYNTSENNRFHLPKKGRKHTCPQCGGRKSFRRYIDGETGKELDEKCGICDHVNRCGYHYPPRELFRDHPELKRREAYGDAEDYGRTSVPGCLKSKVGNAPAEYSQTEFFDMNWVEKASKRHSTFRSWFENLDFEPERIREVLAEYFIGATRQDIVVNGVNHGPAAVFWMIDEQQRVHDAKLIAYTADGHRVPCWGNSMRCICWNAKAGPQLQETEKVLFGLHLIGRYPDKVVCIVESEKSALVCACRYPEYVWLATGGCGNLQASKLRPLMDRKIVVYPDSGEYQKWCDRMKESGHRHYTVVDMLEAYEPNTDIADIILGVGLKKKGDNHADRH